jgi:translation initiation factor IF-2
MDVRLPNELESLAKAEKVKIKTFRIIYDVLDELKELMQRGSTAAKPKEEIVVKGSAIIKQIFEIKAKGGRNS